MSEPNELPRPTEATMNDPALSYIEAGGRFQAVYCPEREVFALFIGPIDDTSAFALVEYIVASNYKRALAGEEELYFKKEPIRLLEWIQEIRERRTKRVVDAQLRKHKDPEGETDSEPA